MTLQILRMAEIVKKQGGVLIANENRDGNKISLGITEIFWNHFDMNQILCFSPKNEEPKLIDEDDRVLTDYKGLDSPEKVFSIEVLGQNITVSEKVNISCIMFCEFVFNGENSIFAFTLYEYDKSPFVFGDMCFDDYYNGVENKVISMEMPDGEGVVSFFANNILSNIGRIYIDRMNQEKSGVQKVNERIKIKRDGQNIIHKIKKVIHITPEKNSKNYEKEKGIEIDWSHRWMVRGSYHNFYVDEARTIIDKTKIGKDRNGEYNQIGRTWHNSHIKGPEDKPLVKKIKVVD